MNRASRQPVLGKSGLRWGRGYSRQRIGDDGLPVRVGVLAAPGLVEAQLVVDAQPQVEAVEGSGPVGRGRFANRREETFSEWKASIQEIARQVTGLPAGALVRPLVTRNSMLFGRLKAPLKTMEPACRHTLSGVIRNATRVACGASVPMLPSAWMRPQRVCRRSSRTRQSRAPKSTVAPSSSGDFRNI